MKTFLKTKTCQVVLLVLYRALKTLVRKESRIKKEFSSFTDGYCIKITLNSKGDGLINKKENGRLIKVRESAFYDIEIRFKSIDSAFLVFTGCIGLSRAYSEHRFALKGDIREAMALVRIIDLAESYLFPSIMSKRILRSLPKKERSSLSVYRMVLLGF